METSGTLMRGEPNFPPIAPILLKVKVPPDISSELSLLARANSWSRASSFVIWLRTEMITIIQIYIKSDDNHHSEDNHECKIKHYILDKKQYQIRRENTAPCFKQLKFTSKIERDWTFFMLGTTRPCGVAIAIPMLWDPFQMKKNR